ncbi:helix-turn-helix transcriptional regulator [Streptacidiphilus sp. P02-A3a]|uniref:helix-turn-helix transcriptional regulator n=1 Tax=Streptacidiphilus sp. P02-A3a TaxID=2704468 RepID=UPI0015FD7BDA|nr:helix-turn-helix transcriptional regulator [Streptacidiphilus sp. P02-A3a]QMU71706.1 helix-turn-helix transcriptional regulator [Streptacidiphilus sp. P02-A3a]
MQLANNGGSPGHHRIEPSSEEIAVYRWTARHEHVDLQDTARELGLTPEAVGTALRSLTMMGLLRADASDPDRLRMVDPDLVVATKTASLESAIHQQQTRLDQIRERFGSLRSHYLEALSRTNEIEVIARMEEVRGALTRASADCGEEMLASQPGGNRVPKVLEEALSRDRAMLSRGVRMRTLYHHTARFNGPSQAYVAALSPLGAEYRTAHELFGRLIIYDRRVAFIPERSATWGAVVIREPSIVEYLCSVFEQAWTQAQPFSEAAADGLEAVAKDIDRSILRLLAAGLKDETIARRLGMSLRTARKHIADIMALLGAQSRFQAGVLAAARGLLAPEEPGEAPDIDG